MNSKKSFFDIPENITYLNGGYMSPLLKTVADAGCNGVELKLRPWEFSDTDFFENRLILKQRFAQLIDAKKASFTAIIPSVSYGMANAARNIRFDKGDEIVVIDEQFPSNVYIWQEVARETNAVIKTVNAPEVKLNRGKLWNEKLLNTISAKTRVVTIPQVHWADGTLFKLEAIREACDQYGAKLIIDGTQSIGAYPFSVQKIRPDALICGGYKWLLGPYSIGMAYYNETFHEGRPIEENWMNRLHSEDFGNLVKYQSHYQPDAGKFNVGESSNFILVPMFIKAIEQLLEWQPSEIQKYCMRITKKAIQQIENNGCFVEVDNFRANHLFGVFLQPGRDLENIKHRLKEQKVFVSYRGNAIRISPNVYNSDNDLLKFTEILTAHL